VGNSNTLGFYWLIISHLEAFFLKERVNVCDNLHNINRTGAFLKFEMNARQRNTFSTLALKIGTVFLTTALRKTEATPRSADQLPQKQGKERVFNLAMFA
jgi:hypothetical protein